MSDEGTFKCQVQGCSERTLLGFRVGRRDGGMYVEPRCHAHIAQFVPVSRTSVVRLSILAPDEAVEIAHAQGVLMFDERPSLPLCL